MGHVIPYHLEKLYQEYKIGYGVLSMQGKEAKNSQIKQELRNCTNRSKECNEKGKWYQFIRANFVRTFYLPYHFPATTEYRPHFTSHVPLVENACLCSRKFNESNECIVCSISSEVVDSGHNGALTARIAALILPFSCEHCEKRFVSPAFKAEHMMFHENPEAFVKEKPSSLTKNRLKALLAARNLSTEGSKKDLANRLELSIR